MLNKHILFKSLNAEVIKTFFGTIAILFSLVVASRLVDYFDKSIEGKLDSALIGLLILLKIPEFINLLFPICFFIAIVILISRLNADSEIYALYSGGFSKNIIVLCLLPLAITFASLSAILSFYVSPFTEKKVDFLTSSIGLEQKLKLINEGNLNDLGNGTYLFFNKLDGSTYKNILLIDDSEELSIIQADSLQFSFDKQNHLNFQNGSAIFFSNSSQPIQSNFNYLQTSTEREELLTQDSNFGKIFSFNRNKESINFEWAVAIPITLFNLLLIGVYLVQPNPRQGRFIGIIPSLFIYFLYLSLLIIFRDGAVDDANFAKFGLWPIHFVFFLGAGYLMYKDNFATPSNNIFKSRVFLIVMAFLLILLLMWLF